jgi:hypothetical protein
MGIGSANRPVFDRLWNILTSATPFGVHVSDVVDLCPWKEMIGVDTGGDIAVVTDVFTGLQRSCIR